jgi:hypothetical protein
MQPFPTIRPGVVVQLAPDHPSGAGGCFAVVESASASGCQLRVPVPLALPGSRTGTGLIVRADWTHIECVGMSHWLPRGIATQPGTKGSLND